MTVQEHMQKLIALNSVIQSNLSDQNLDKVYEEFRYHQAVIVTEYLPLLRTLVDAGVLNVLVPGEILEITSVCENGGIQLNAEELMPLHVENVHQLN